MKKKLISLGVLGFPMGIAIGFVITIVISICVGDGSFYPVTPALIDTMGNELNAVILQTVLCGVMGSGFAMISLICATVVMGSTLFHSRNSALSAPRKSTRGR